MRLSRSHVMNRSASTARKTQKMLPDGLQVAQTQRRSLYLMARRNYPLNFLTVFDYPLIDTNCTRRVPLKIARCSVSPIDCNSVS